MAAGRRQGLGTDAPLPGWLLEDERYHPRAGRDRFLDRSILAFLGLLARCRPRDGEPVRATQAEPLVKLLALLGTLLLLALSRSPVLLALAGSGVLALLAVQDAKLIAGVLRTACSAALFTSLVLLPSIWWGLGPAAALLTAKVFLSVACVRLVSASTEWTALAGACKRLGAPDLFLLVFDIALKYLVLLGEFSLAQLQALKLRSVGRNERKADSLAGITGTLFLKSREMADEMHDAMACRGFTGEYRAARRFRPGPRDAALGAALAFLAAAFFLTGRR